MTLAGPQRLKGTYSPEAFLLVAKVSGGVPSINLHSLSQWLRSNTNGILPASPTSCLPYLILISPPELTTLALCHGEYSGPTTLLSKPSDKQNANSLITIPFSTSMTSLRPTLPGLCWHYSGHPTFYSTIIPTSLQQAYDILTGVGRPMHKHAWADYRKKHYIESEEYTGTTVATRPPPPVLSDPAAFPSMEAAATAPNPARSRLAPLPKKGSSTVTHSYAAEAPVSIITSSPSAPSTSGQSSALPLAPPMPVAAPASPQPASFSHAPSPAPAPLSVLPGRPHLSGARFMSFSRTQFWWPWNAFLCRVAVI